MMLKYRASLSFGVSKAILMTAVPDEVQNDARASYSRE